MFFFLLWKQLRKSRKLTRCATQKRSRQHCWIDESFLHALKTVVHNNHLVVILVLFSKSIRVFLLLKLFSCWAKRQRQEHFWNKSQSIQGKKTFTVFLSRKIWPENEKELQELEGKWVINSSVPFTANQSAFSNIFSRFFSLLESFNSFEI